jgi:hypothetical protein
MQQDTVDCQEAVIPFETATLEKIIREPEMVVKQAQSFWSSEYPLLLAQGWADEVGSRNPGIRFLKRVTDLAELSEDERAVHPLLQLTETIIARQDEWREKALPLICSHLPAGVDLSRPVYFVAYIPPRAFATSEGIVIDVAADYWQGTPENILNCLIHEYFHIGYGQLRRQRSETPPADARLYKTLDMIQNEGLAVWIGYRAQSLFPAPGEKDYRLLDSAADVTRLLKALNGLIGETGTITADEFKRRAWKIGVTDRAYYIVGAHMARTIESKHGTAALIQTLRQGPHSYILRYNSLVPEERRLHPPDKSLDEQQ